MKGHATLQAKFNFNVSKAFTPSPHALGGYKQVRLKGSKIQRFTFPLNLAVLNYVSA